ncbi:MAG: TetR/AcrR family transcriptional regulator [Pseudomonadota bacterium]
MNLREQKKADTSARLVSVARKNFAERGYADTSMDELCAEAGVTRGALYHNFGGKDGLFEAVVRQIDHEIGERLLAIAEGDESLEGFIKTCVAYLEMAMEPDVQQIMFKDGPAVLGQRLREIDQEGSIEPLRDAIEGLQAGNSWKPGDAMAYAILINGAMIDAALWIASDRHSATRSKAAAQALAQLIEGLSV